MSKSVYEFLPIYDRHIFYSNDLGHCLKLIEKYYKPGELDLDGLELEVNFKGICAPIYDKKDETFIRCLVIVVDDSEGVGTVTHEATHLTNFVFVNVGQDLDIINDEAQAYLSGYLAQRFMELIRGHKNKDGKLVKRGSNVSKKKKR